MKIAVVLNRDGGTLKTTDLDRFSRLIEDEFGLHGHSVDIALCSGGDIVESIQNTVRIGEADVLLVGGGDGTVSAAAAALMNSRMALGILPAGTMNLYARTLQVPLVLTDAVKSLADGRIVEVDIATVNGQPFVHQFAVGMHARMVRLRERLAYGSRFGKMLATTRAIVTTLQSLPTVDLEIEMDGRIQRLRTPALAVSNNIYGEGHLPFADDPRGGKLGVYIFTTRDVRAVAKLTLDILRGTWRGSNALTVHTADRIVIDYSGRRTKNRAVRDGELIELQRRSEVLLHPKGLQVLVPSEAGYLKQPSTVEQSQATAAGPPERAVARED